MHHEAGSPGSPFSRGQQHHRVERSSRGQPHCLQLVRASGPDGGTGQIRFPVPGGRAPVAGAERAHLRPGRCRPPRHVHGAGCARRGHRASWPGRHHQLHLQRALRSGAPVRQPRSSLGRARRVERRHLMGRLHGRELPPWWLLGPGGPLLPGRAVSADRHGALRLLVARGHRGGQGIGNIPGRSARRSVRTP